VKKTVARKQLLTKTTEQCKIIPHLLHSFPPQARASPPCDTRNMKDMHAVLWTRSLISYKRSCCNFVTIVLYTVGL